MVKRRGGKGVKICKGDYRRRRGRRRKDFGKDTRYLFVPLLGPSLTIIINN
jgi:hypothetical protein